MSRSCKAIPRLIVEGYAKEHQKKRFQKYLVLQMGESNEMIVCLNHCYDFYGKYINAKLCLKLSESYDKLSRQLYKLSLAWSSLKENNPVRTHFNLQTTNDTIDEN